MVISKSRQHLHSVLESTHFSFTATPLLQALSFLALTAKITHKCGTKTWEWANAVGTNRLAGCMVATYLQFVKTQYLQNAVKPSTYKRLAWSSSKWSFNAQHINRKVQIRCFVSETVTKRQLLEEIYIYTQSKRPLFMVIKIASPWFIF